MKESIRLVGMQTIASKSWDLENVARVGRVSGMEIQLDDASISRRHAELYWSEKGWNVRDLGSTNGTYINGLRIGRVNRQINQGDQLRFGNMALFVERIGEQPSSRAVFPEIRHKSVSQVNEQTTTVELSQLLASANRQQSDRSTPKLWNSTVSTLKDLLICVVQETAACLDAATAFVATMDQTLHRLVVQAGIGKEIESNEMHHALNLAERAFGCRESLLFDKPGAQMPGQDPFAQNDSTLCAMLRAGDVNLGVLQLYRGAGQAPFTDRDLLLADALAARWGARIHGMQASLNQQQQVIISSVVALAQAVELRDEYTGGHTQRVTDYALLLADEMKLTERERYYLQVGTPLHDLGKIGIADSVLRKPGRLTPVEFELMKTHASHGAHIVETIPELNPVLSIVRNHHERWDGKGYPDGLAGEKIPLLARVVAVVDVFDAMTSDRPYRPALTLDRAFDELRAGSGTQFDPECVSAFCRVRGQIEKIMRENSMAANTTRPAEMARLREELLQMPTLRQFAESAVHAQELANHQTVLPPTKAAIQGGGRT